MRVRWISTLPFLIALGACASVPVSSQRVPPPPPALVHSSQLDFFFGVRSLDQDDWAPVEDHGVIGITFVHEPEESAVGLELGFAASGEKEDDVPFGGGTVDVEGRTSEISAGVRKTFVREEGFVHPYLGAGIAAIRAEFEGSPGSKDDDSSPGIYFHGGMDFDLGTNFLLGFDMRFLGGTDITLFGDDGTADYAQFVIFLGVRF